MKKLTMGMVILLCVITIVWSQDKAEAWRKIGLEYLSNQQADKAVPYFKMALRMNPENGILHSELGYAYQMLEDYESALMEYTAAIGLKGAPIPDVKFNMGIVFAKEEQFDQALTNFNEVLSIDINYKDAYLNRGIIFIQEGLYRDAEKDLTTFLEMDPENEQRPEIEKMLALLKQMRDFPVQTVDKSQYLEKRELEDELNRNRERLSSSPRNQFLGNR